MNWEAVWLIAVFVGGPCALLLGLGLLMARRWSRTHPSSEAATPLPWKFIAIESVAMVCLMGGVLSQYWAPDSELAALTGSVPGLIAYCGSVIIIAGVIVSLTGAMPAGRSKR